MYGRREPIIVLSMTLPSLTIGTRGPVATCHVELNASANSGAIPRATLPNVESRGSTWLLPSKHFRFRFTAKAKPRTAVPIRRRSHEFKSSKMIEQRRQQCQSRRTTRPHDGKRNFLAVSMSHLMSSARGIARLPAVLQMRQAYPSPVPVESPGVAARSGNAATQSNPRLLQMT